MDLGATRGWFVGNKEQQLPQTMSTQISFWRPVTKASMRLLIWKSQLLLQGRNTSNLTYCQYRQLAHNQVIRCSNMFLLSNCHRIELLPPVICRGYAKGKDKKKGDKGKSKKVEIREDELAEVVDVEKFKTQLQKAVENLKNDYIKHVSLRSATGSIESLPVNVDGNEHVLQELGQIVRKNPKTIVINMSAFPQAIPAALEAIRESGMNLNPQQDGTTLFIPVPTVTKEHRESLAKNAKMLFVKCRDNIKDVQNDYIRKAKKKDMSSDLIFRAQEQIVAIAGDFISQAEKKLETKQKELLGKD